MILHTLVHVTIIDGIINSESSVSKFESVSAFDFISISVSVSVN